jgi:predicted porin
MRRLGIILLASVGMASLAHAADLPTKKAVEAAPKPNCFASVWDWLNTTAADCPLSYAGFTFYGTLDVGYGYQDWGAPRNPSADKPFYGIQKAGYTHTWTATYAGLSSNVLGIKMKEDLAPIGLAGWSIIGLAEAGFNPYSGMLLNPPRSLADNNTSAANGVITIKGKKYPGFYQTANFDSSRNGSWWNSQAFLGISNTTFGSLTFGRTNSLSYDLISAYDPMGASTAFSLFGFSNSFAGFGDTVTVRPNTAFTYKVAYQNFRAGAQVQVGGYNWGNGTTGQYQGTLGADFGPFSLDGVISYAENAVSLSTFGGGNLAELGKTNQWFININNAYYDPNSVLKATLSNNFGLGIGGKYKWNQFTFYAGYLYANLMNPSNDELGGFDTVSRGLFVPGGYWKKSGKTYVFTNDAITANAYNNNRALSTFWGGLKWSATSNLDFMTGIWYQTQNNYNTTACTGNGINISSSKCSGGQSAVSLMADWRPVKRVDIYAGVMLTSVYGGLANGYLHSQSYDPTVGLRVRF